MKLLSTFAALTRPTLQPSWGQDLMLAVPRIICGYLLTSDFGAAKFGLPWSPPDNNLGFFEVAFWFPKDVAEYGGIFALFPSFFAWMAGFSEAVGGIAWIIGLQTRVFSFLMFCTMFVAAFVQQSQNGTWNMLPAIGFMWVSMVGMALGSGRFGLDNLLFKPKHNTLILTAFCTLLFSQCVQKAHEQTVTFKVDVSKIKDVKTVGLRGGEKPLSWDLDKEMTAVVKDSIYTTTATFLTGYKFTEIKFVVNGEFELKDKPNRKVVYDADKTTVFEAVYETE